MLLWIDVVLKPYIGTTPHGIIPYLLLDKYKCHSTGLVAKAIEDLGVEWDIIPGGCTGLAQPIDRPRHHNWYDKARILHIDSPFP